MGTSNEKNQRTCTSFSALSVVVATLISHNALASQSLKLNSVQITQDSENLLGSSSQISREKIKQSISFDAKDTLKNELSIDIGGGNRNAQRIYMRGIEGSNINITIDGAKQGRNLFQHRGDMLGIDPSLLKKVKVQTLANGESNGLAGGIAFESVDAQELLGSQNIGAAIRSGYTSSSRGANGGVSLFGKLYEKGALLLDISGQNLEDYRTGSGEKSLNSASKDKNYFAKMTILDGAHSLRLSALSNKNRAHYITGGPGSDFGIPSLARAASLHEITQDTYSLRHQYNPENPYINIESKIYFNKKALKNLTNTIDVSSENLGGSIKNGIYFEILSSQNNIDFGIDFDDEDGKSNSSINKKLVNNKSENLGVFARINSQLGALKLSYGARFDDFQSEFGSKELKGNELSPFLGIEYEIVENLSLFAKYSEAVRASGTMPIQWMGNITSKTNINDGNALKPEESTQKEGGIKYITTLNNGTQIGFSSAIFETTLKNLIQSSGGGRAIAKVWNSQKDVISKGYELRASWETSDFGVSLGYTKAKLEDNDGNRFTSARRIAASSGNKLVLDSMYALSPKLRAGYTMSALKGLDGVYDRKRSGYALHDVWLEWLPKGVDGLSLNFAIKNLADKSYYSHASFAQGDAIVKESGRDFRLSMRYQF